MDGVFYLEFSFFLCLLIALISLYSVFLSWLLRTPSKPGLLRKISAVAVLIPIGLLSWQVAVFFVLLILIVQLPMFKNPAREWVFLLSVGVVLTFGVGFFYFANLGDIWESLNRAVFSFLDLLHLKQGYRFVDIYSIFRFFRNYYPGFVSALSVFWVLRSRWSRKYSVTCYYRYTKLFSHFLLAPLLLFVIGLILASRLPETHALHRYFLNFVIFFSLPYLLYGGLTLFYGLRRIRRNTQLFLVLIYSLIIFSGPLFLFILILVIGVGVSDVWMNYNRRLKKHPS